MFADYRELNGMTFAELSKILKRSESTVKHQIVRPDDAWKVSEIRDYCKALKAPFADALARIK